MGGAARRFPATRPSVLELARSDDPDRRRVGFDALIAAYWKPVYTYVRLTWRADNEDAKDLTQGFFQRAMEKDFFDGYQPSKARFRTFLRRCLDGYLANAWRGANRLKRGGGAQHVPLDDALGTAAATEAEAEALFHREWVRSVFAQAVETLRARCAADGLDTRFAVFRRYDLEGLDQPVPPTYADLARELRIPVTQVTNHLHWARDAFRDAVLTTLRSVCGSEAEYREEVRELLGASPP